MTDQDILKNKVAIAECAKSFRQDANNLMSDLSKDFNFSLEGSAPFEKEVYSHKYNNKGQFRNEWTYYFHGAECRFDNFKTGQIVELICITKPEFGYLDGFFFFNYMATTARFKKLADLILDGLNAWAAIDRLADAGILTRDLSVTINRNIIAR